MKNGTLFLLILVLFYPVVTITQQSSKQNKTPHEQQFEDEDQFREKSFHKEPFRNRGLIPPGYIGDSFFKFGKEEILPSLWGKRLKQETDYLPESTYPSANEFSTFSSGVDTAWIKHYGSENVPSDDWANAIVSDDMGNIYVTGSTEFTWSGRDFLTIKYDSIGNKLWESFYNGPGNGSDQANAIDLDNDGNVYVTGSAYATIKYSPDGNEEWVAQYTDPENGDATAIAVDNIGNVYVTGDRVTIKYSSDGIEQWAEYYNGIGYYYWGTANDIAIGNTGDVYVTGNYVDSNTVAYSTAIKYNSNGVEQWILQIDSSQAVAIAVDNSDYVYMTGGKGDYHKGWGGPGYFSSDSVLTLKLNSDGVNIWSKSYGGTEDSEQMATDLEIDDSGNVHVAGWSNQSGKDIYTTTKYNAEGEQQWIVNYNGPGSSYANAIALDSFGNVYVAGGSESSDTSMDCSTVKYNAQGEEQWVARYNNSNNSNGLTALTVNSSGNVYATGWSEGNGTAYDFVTIKYNTNGVEKWVAIYNGAGTSNDLANAMAIDDLGNIYVTGWNQGGGKSDSAGWATVKYDPDGLKLWTKRNVILGSNHPTNPRDICADPFGNVYVIGASGTNNTIAKCSTVKYNSDGIELWNRQIAITTHNPGIDVKDLVIDNLGSVYVTDVGGERKYSTIKYNPEGIQQWAANYGGNGTARAKAIALDKVGNVFVTGMILGNNMHTDFGTIKYDYNGIEQWVARYYGAEESSDEANALTVDDSGNVYVTGKSYVFDNGEQYADWIIIKYDAMGIQQWVKKRRMESRGDPGGTHIAMDGSRGIYVMSDDGIVNYYTDGTIKNYFPDIEGAEWTIDDDGSIYITSTFATVKYNKTGELQWKAIYDRFDLNDWCSMDIVLDASKNVYVTGTSEINGSSVYTTIKYVQTPVSVERDDVNIPDNYSLSQNYPNPFNPSTTIKFTLPKSEYVELKVFNLLGEEVSTLVSNKLNQGNHTYQFDGNNLASGIYYYRIEAGEFHQVKKMILLK